MEGAKYLEKSKLYCSYCGSFNLTRSRLSSIKRFLFHRPLKLVCQSCHGKIKHTKMLSNTPQYLPKIYCASDEAVVLSSDKLGRPIYISMNDLIDKSTTSTHS